MAKFKNVVFLVDPKTTIQSKLQTAIKHPKEFLKQEYLRICERGYAYSGYSHTLPFLEMMWEMSSLKKELNFIYQTTLKITKHYKDFQK